MARWYKLYRQYRNGYHMESYDITELLQLNMLVLEMTHEVHNESMSNNPFSKNK